TVLLGRPERTEPGVDAPMRRPNHPAAIGPTRARNGAELGAHCRAMGFFERNRAELVERGYDPARLPPGQYLTDRFPVLHVGDVPTYAPGEWNLTIYGLVDNSFTIDVDELKAMPSVTLTFDIHCVTKWSKFDTTWTGVRVRDLFERAGVKAGATHVMEHAEFGYTTNI